MVRAAFAVLLGLTMTWPATTSAQYWGDSRQKHVASSATPGAVQPELEVSPEQASKTSFAILKMIQLMNKRRATRATVPSDWSDMSTDLVKVNPAGEIQVYVVLSELPTDHIAQLEAAGLRVELTYENTVQGWASTRALEALAALGIVREIRTPGYALTNQSGAADTAGNARLRVNEARAAFGVTGAGVPIGVISDGVQHLSNTVATGDLPQQGGLLRAGSGDEGTAMLEIVHDLAPGAPLLFYGTSGLTSLGMVQAINSLAAAGARVIVDDLVFPDQPKFQDGPIALAARNFANNGRVYVTSANNYAQQHYRGQYSPVDFPVTLGGRSYQRHHAYATNGDIRNTFVLPAGCQVKVFFQWNNTDGGAADDFDLVLVRASDGTVMTVSQNHQSGTQRPWEALTWPPAPSPDTQTLFVAVAEFSLSNPAPTLTIDYFVVPTCLTAYAPLLKYTVPEASVWGQAAVAEVLSVAAADAETGTIVRPYSARGPGLISFPSPETRNVPNITAVDCVQTQVGQLGYFAASFCGTSAAAPHVAGIAALLIERNPALTSEQIRAFLAGAALDIDSPGFDFAAGFGRVDALDAVGAVPPPGQIALAASVLPSSRSVQVTHAATAFASIVASGAGTATGCSVGPITSLPGTFSYQPTNPATNLPNGPANAPVNIAGGSIQSFIISFTPSAPFPPTDVQLRFDCTNTDQAPVVGGVNTLLLSASQAAVPDIVAIALSSAATPGIVAIPGTQGTGVFVVASVNVGASGFITVTADTSEVSLPVSLSVCQTNPANSQCLAAAAPSVSTQINAGQTPTFALFVRANGIVPFSPAVNRVFVRFRDGGGITRGATSMAVATQ